MTQLIAQGTHKVQNFYDRIFYSFTVVTKEKIVSWKQTPRAMFKSHKLPLIFVFISF